MHIGIIKQIIDTRALAKINNAYKEIGFERLYAISDSHTRILIRLFTFIFISGDICYKVYNMVINQRIKVAGDKLVYNKELLSEKNMSNISVSLLISFVMHITGKNKELFTRLCRDIQSIILEEAGILGCPQVGIQAVIALIELIYHVKYTILNISEGLQELYSSNYNLFNEYYYESKEAIIQPVL